MSEEYQRCKQAADYLNNIFDAKDAIGIILGSGLGDMAEEINNPIIVDYADIPNFPKTTVPGHEGKMILGDINGVKVLCMKGRFHYYEGHDIKTVVMPVRVMKLLGIRLLIITNAAGGVNETFKPGTLMFIDDFINYMAVNPLRGINDEEFGTRFPDMSNAINKKYNAIAKQCAADLQLDNIASGVYMSFMGPSFETPAEIRFASKIGADAVGMSTVPEIIAARHCNLPVIAISCITNMAAGICIEELSHEDVQKTADSVKDKFKLLLKEIITKI